MKKGVYILKNKLKKIISLILPTVMILNMLGNYVLADENTKSLSVQAVNKVLTSQTQASSQNTDKHSNGFIPYKVKITKDSTNARPNLKAAAPLPASYDLRKTGLLTSVKDQGQVDDCWAFSAIASLESNLLRIENNTYDFSEINMATHNDINNDANYGGNNEIATSYLVSWKGPVNELDDPYPTDPNNIIIRNGLKESKHVQDVIFIPDRLNSLDNSELKQAIMNYGAVSSSLYMDEYSYLNSAGDAYYNYGSTLNNHAIDIVGWDDNYSKNNFAATPAGDGAFICKNSWGTDFGDGGYFYVSYYDVSIGYDNAVYDGIESVYNYSKNYQYDLQYSGTASYGQNNWFSNVFTAGVDSSNQEVLEAVSFYTDKENTSYSVYAESDYASNKFTKLSSNLMASGTIAMPGYHTVKLSKPLTLNSGKQFAVAVSVSGSTIPLDYDRPSNGNSFTSYDGNQWAAYGKTIDLKAFTNEGSRVPVTGISLSNTSLNFSVSNTAKLSASVAPSNATDKNVIWSSSNSSIATVDGLGNVKGVSPGNAVITAKSEDGGYTAQCTVSVKTAIAVKSVSVGLQPVDVNSDVELTFANSIYKGTNFNSITLKDSNGNLVPASASINNNVLTVKSNANLNNGTMYYVNVPVNSIIDISGCTLVKDYSINFVTVQSYNPDVKFGDINVENQIRYVLGKPTGNITSDDMASLDNLYLGSSQVRNLKGLEYAVNLTSLDLSYNKITDISPLKNLLSLINLELGSNRISDLEPIKNLTNLSEISLGGNNISDLSPLANLSKLTSLSADDNYITDLTPIENLFNLNYVSLYANEISDLQALVNNFSQNNGRSDTVLDIWNNFVDLTPGTDSYNEHLALKGMITNYYFVYQRSGAIFSNTDRYNTPCYGPYVVKFKNNIQSDSGFNQISISDSNGNNIDIDKYISGNKLIIKPKKLLDVNTSYNISIPSDAIIDSDNKTVNADMFNFTTTDNTVDINNDGVIDIKDIAATAQNYNLTWNDGSKWNESYDVNDDGVVDVYDLMDISRWKN